MNLVMQIVRKKYESGDADGKTKYESGDADHKTKYESGDAANDYNNSTSQSHFRFSFPTTSTTHLHLNVLQVVQIRAKSLVDKRANLPTNDIERINCHVALHHQHFAK